MRQRKQIVIDYHQKFGDEQGGRVLANLRKRFPWLDRPTVSVGQDVNAILIAQGEANVLKHIYRMMRVDPYEMGRQEKASDRSLGNIQLVTGESK